MTESTEPAYFVNAQSDPVVLKINGRATYLNCKPVADFFTAMLNHGKKNYIVDFSRCSGMDSTFLGILAGLGRDLLSQDPPGQIILARIAGRNLELVRNVGIHRITRLETDEAPLVYEAPAGQLAPSAQDRDEQARMILKAHQNLLDIDESNKAKFQDVISFLKSQLGSS